MKQLSLLIILFFVSLSLTAQKASGDFYLVKLYHCVSTSQVDHVEKYVGDQLIPFLKKNGIRHVGVFLPLANDTAADKRLMVWAPLSKLDVLEKLEKAFGTIDPFGNDPLAGLDSFGRSAPYTRIETMLATAFPMHPRYSAKSTFQRGPENIYEFRSYESSTEKKHLGKVEMFNQGGEIDIFRNLDFNAVFYGRVIVGARMPNLIYMTSFKNMEERNDRWNKFRNDPAWKALSPQAKYAGNVSRNETILMRPSKYNAID